MIKKVFSILIKIIIIIAVVVGIIVFSKFINSKQIIEKDINDVSIVCLDTGKETNLKKDEIIEFTPHLVDIYKMKDSNFNKWDLTKKIKIIINKKNILKLTDYDEAHYYGYYNDDTVIIPTDVYKIANKYCEEDKDGQEQNNG